MERIRMLKKTPLWRILFIVLIQFLWILTAEAKLGDQVYETTLTNGLKVILLENHKSPLVTFQIWYRVGSRNESWGKTGLSHMMEHMMYKGTQKVGPEEFSRIIQANGGDDNAFTTQDYTSYFVNISSDRIQIPIDLEADRMQNLTLKEVDFRTEHMVIMEERRLTTEDDPQAYVSEQVEAAAFQISPYHWPVIGWEEDIESFTLDEVKAHHRLFYHPANAFLVVAGDFKKDEILPKIEKAFGSIPKSGAPDQRKNAEKLQIGERRIIVKREAELPYLLIGYHVPNLTDQDSYVLEVIAALLSQGKSSRFYENLVSAKKLVLDADAENSLLSKDSNLFYLSAELAPGKDIQEAEHALYDEIQALQKEPVGIRELEKVKNQIEAAFICSQDSISMQAMLLGQYEIVTGWRTIDDYLPSIQKVTQEDIQRVAKKYLVEDNRTVGILIPSSPREVECIQSESNTINARIK
jgi:zinc protease